MTASSKNKKKKPTPNKKEKKEKESLAKKLDEQDSLFGSLMEENYKVISKVKKKKKY